MDVIGDATLDRTVEELLAQLAGIAAELGQAPTMVAGPRPGTRSVNPEVVALLARERRLAVALRVARARRRPEGWAGRATNAGMVPG